MRFKPNLLKCSPRRCLRKETKDNIERELFKNHITNIFLTCFQLRLFIYRLNDLQNWDANFVVQGHFLLN